ncbi:Holliday junction DNA helicase RuvA [Sorangium cellulosum]|uniref:Holliday junction branch migration complex subunit RuvA n=1 Tax=Sorangium cellulosum TaxID=56 RepID=A0A4P2PTG3_SORCE|nr:Holliday junction branch migration protein RuvA [Sorangium cellulosum]AUX19907.1 Holliday junction DNA helicase RuvA [Sorangium cellulosum]
MIGRLTGRVVEEGDDGTVVLDVGGVGYEVAVPLGAVGRARGLAAAAGADAITLFVHTHVREDALLLYGFATREDRTAFRVLIGVSSVGPKIAVGILSALAAGDLAAVIARRETARLTAIPGVGKKTAERLVLELKDKLVGLPSAAPSPAAPPPAATGSQQDLLHSALTRMGYRPAEAERAIAALGARVDSAPLGDLVRDALALLSK